jgi:hypothetical protein
VKKNRIIIILIISISILNIFKANAGELPDAKSSHPDEITADNGIIRVKFDLKRGGSISYISVSGKERNLVNTFDEGRYIQQSYYAGKEIDRKAEGQSPRWSPWAWNPIQAGDDFKNRAEILDYKQSAETLYTKCIPMQWDMNNKPAEAIMEQWAFLSGNVIKVHNKLTCSRTDTLYGDDILCDQELPAVYPVSSLCRLYYYAGNKPFTNDTLSNPEAVLLSSGFWGRYPEVPEHWMAFTDSSNSGMAVYNPMCTYFIAGMAGRPGGESKDGSTSYIAPVKKEMLKKNSVYEYDYYIIIGTLKDIREKIYLLNKKGFRG